MLITLAGRFTECLLLSYSTPAESVRHLLPAPLTLATHAGQAFWSVVVSAIEGMRPAGLPRWTGVSYHHVAYRLYVRSDAWDGIYFVRSDADHHRLCLLGNALTDFRFHYAAIDFASEHDSVHATVSGRAPARVVVGAPQPFDLLPGSCFKSLEEREALLKYRPLGLSVARGNKLRLAEVFRNEADWQESAVEVRQADFSYLQPYEARLERATRMAPIEYRWRLGRSVTL